MRYCIDHKTGNKISALGFGCMRFPSSTFGSIDIDATEKLILQALKQGINYFDTAYLYPHNEEALGIIMERNNIRDRMLIATKLPHVSVKSIDDAQRYLSTSLEHLRTDHVDYYLIHNVGSLEQWQRLCDLGIESWIAERKFDGTIGAIGFSFHGPHHEFAPLLDAYDWDFCQIQYNYADENYQAGRKGLEEAHARNIPVFIMEPLLGGKLSDLPAKASDLFMEAEADRRKRNSENGNACTNTRAGVHINVGTNACTNDADSSAESNAGCSTEGNADCNAGYDANTNSVEESERTAVSVAWALRWLWNQPGVTMVLSGMNSPEQIDQNVITAVSTTPGSLTERELETYHRVEAIFRENYRIPCTGCNYCMPCPKGINIPGCFTSYNMSYTNGWTTGVIGYFMCAGALGNSPHYASDCIKCGKCAKHCPQGIAIPDQLARVRHRLQIPGGKAVMSFVSKVRV